MKIVKFFKSLFNHPGICKSIYKGLVVAEASLEGAVSSLKETSPDFKFLNALEKTLKFVSLAKVYIGNYISIFGVDTEELAVCALGGDFSALSEGNVTTKIDEICKEVESAI